MSKSKLHIRCRRVMVLLNPMESKHSLAAARLIRRGWAEAVSIHAHLDGLLDAEANPNELEAPHDKYIPINQQRVKRIRKTLVKNGLRGDLMEALGRIPKGTKMLVLNEFWCGDGAQILPVHEAMVERANTKLEVRVLMRDAHLQVMDLFLTHGNRSIPMTVLLDAELQILGTWGPRPAEAMSLARRIKADSSIAHTYNAEVHKWYAQNKQQNIQAELAVLLEHAYKSGS